VFPHKCRTKDCTAGLKDWRGVDLREHSVCWKTSYVITTKWVGGVV